MRRILGIVILLLLAPAFLFGQDREDVISLLYELDVRSTRFENEITFIEEFNFGILGGINWLVQWYQEENGRPSIVTMVYVVDTDNKEIKFRDQVGLTSRAVPPLIVSYYRNLPGVTIENGNCQIGDFNNDGFDEIFVFSYGASSPSLYIRGYDTLTGERKYYCDVPFDNRENGSPAVEFITYKGMNGFKVRFFVYEVAGGPGWVPDPDPRNRKWIFYTWDEGKREFVEVEEFVEDIEPSQPILAEQNTDEVKLEENRFVQEETAFTPADSEKSTKSILYIAIISAIAVLAAVVVFIVLKMKKK